MDLEPKWSPPTLTPHLDLETFYEQSWLHGADPLRHYSYENSRWASHTLRYQERTEEGWAELSLEKAPGLPSVWLPSGDRKIQGSLARCKQVKDNKGAGACVSVTFNVMTPFASKH